VANDIVAFVLEIAGLAAISVAGFVLALWVGLLVTGISLIAVSWLLPRSIT
jgi:hypothetical protein